VFKAYKRRFIGVKPDESSRKAERLKDVETSKGLQVTNKPTRPYGTNSREPDKLKRGFRTRANIQKIFSRT
jgi:hypothetical protein